MLSTILTHAYDRFYFSRLRNTLTLRRSLLLALFCLAVALIDDLWPGTRKELFPPWVDGLVALTGILLLLSLIPDLIGYRASMLNLIPCGRGRWEIRLALIPFLRARSMAQLESNYLELEVFTLLRHAYALRAVGTITMASYLFTRKERRAACANDIQAYFIGWQAHGQENLSRLPGWQAFLINRLIHARSRGDGKSRPSVEMGPVHGIVIQCRPDTFL
ncbi:MAG: hypothetical protein JO171_04320 [Paludibacterium sp.]|uniref:hypothetical protein n=1 Tax=Paludibacterium sp. TaxID=1917523 RepID=UPI0025E2E8B2|nr:hypothetical protein [Paludibacterium sp.]MBV8046349.1 hypothetical protein [Paludibacterium sp.]MBV8649535.1 hypothetical protein [Paludibacterium sp.]